MNFHVFKDWFGLDPTDLIHEAGEGSAESAETTIEAQDKPLLTPEQKKALEHALERLLEVKIDRIDVSPVFAKAVANTYFDHGTEWEYVNLTMTFPALGHPQQVAFVWHGYETRVGFGFPRVDAELEAYGKTVYPLFREKEPEFIWHMPEEIPPPPEIVLPKPQPPPTVTLPLLSLALFPFLILGFFVTRSRGVPPRERWMGLGIGLVVLVALSPLAKTVVALPGGGFVPPAEQEALYTSQTLLRNIYRAFESDQESAIYDTLAKSVSGPLLASIYLEINQSLVMQEEGGAVAKIESVEILENALLPRPDEHARYFVTRTKWRVTGKVGHWGHTHQRVNEYEADLTIMLEDGGWKIARLDVRSQLRVDDGRTVR